MRLGYWMDWDNSYYTMSDENNYTIWGFLKTCHERGWIYKGHDVMPWCPRCGTGISEHEIVTEGYQERTHRSSTCASRCSTRPTRRCWSGRRRPGRCAANVAAAVHPELTYSEGAAGRRDVLPGEGRCASTRSRGEYEIAGRSARAPSWSAGATAGPFDELPGRRRRRATHRVIAWNEVSGRGRHRHRPHRARLRQGGLRALEGATACRSIAPIDEFGVYVDGFDWLTGQYVARRRRADHASTCAEGRRCIASEELHAPLPDLLALRDRSRLPAGRRVVHRHGRAARAA